MTKLFLREHILDLRVILDTIKQPYTNHIPTIYKTLTLPYVTLQVTFKYYVPVN
jgi:hypothetical protein